MKVKTRKCNIFSPLPKIINLFLEETYVYMNIKQPIGDDLAEKKLVNDEDMDEQMHSWDF